MWLGRWRRWRGYRWVTCALKTRPGFVLVFGTGFSRKEAGHLRSVSKTDCFPFSGPDDRGLRAPLRHIYKGISQSACRFVRPGRPTGPAAWRNLRDTSADYLHGERFTDLTARPPRTFPRPVAGRKMAGSDNRLRASGRRWPSCRRAPHGGPRWSACPSFRRTARRCAAT